MFTHPLNHRNRGISLFTDSSSSLVIGLGYFSPSFFAGNAARGMSLVALHNGGGVGIGKAINGGFGLVLDGSERVDRIIKTAIPWDAMGGVARRAWARNSPAIETSIAYNRERKGRDIITLPYIADDEMVKDFVAQTFDRSERKKTV